MVSDNTVIDEVVSFLKDDRFACTPFKEIIRNSDRPNSFLSVLDPENEKRIAQYCQRVMPVNYGYKPAHIFIHPEKISDETRSSILAKTLNLEAAVAIHLLLNGLDDVLGVQLQLCRKLQQVIEDGKDYDLVRDVTSSQGIVLPTLFATYMAPHLPENDTRFAPYPLIAIVRTAVVASVSERVKGEIACSALQRNGPRGFTGAYFPRVGIQAAEVYQDILRRKAEQK